VLSPIILSDNREAVCRRCDEFVTVPIDAFPEDEICSSCKGYDRGNGEVHIDNGDTEHLNGQFVHMWIVQIKKHGKVTNQRTFYHYTQSVEFAERVASIYKLGEVY